MNRTAVVSSSVSSIGYDNETLTLEIEFSRGAVYQYFDVPETEYHALMTAPSIGGYVNQVIKPGYRAVQV